MLCNKLCEDPVLINAFFFQIDDPSSPNTRHISFPLVELLIPHMFLFPSYFILETIYRTSAPRRAEPSSS